MAVPIVIRLTVRPSARLRSYHRQWGRATQFELTDKNVAERSAEQDNRCLRVVKWVLRNAISIFTRPSVSSGIGTTPTQRRSFDADSIGARHAHGAARHRKRPRDQASERARNAHGRGERLASPEASTVRNLNRCRTWGRTSRSTMQQVRHPTRARIVDPLARAVLTLRNRVPCVARACSSVDKSPPRIGSASGPARSACSGSTVREPPDGGDNSDSSERPLVCAPQ
jgi:hypothetical protein